MQRRGLRTDMRKLRSDIRKLHIKNLMPQARLFRSI